MPRLNAAEQRLLRYPPTTETWICPAKLVGADSEPRVCGMYNPGTAQACLICTRPQPRKPKRLWPRYVEVCKKAGIEPGTPWPVRASLDADAPAKAGRRKKGS